MNPTLDVLLEEELRALSDQGKQALLSFLRSMRDGTASKEHSLLELDGLGKEHWQGIDADEHIAAERNSWER